MKALITGGAGFIGSHTARALRARGAKVIAYDSLISGNRENVPDDVELVEADIRDADALARAMQGVTHVVHLAAQVSVKESVNDPKNTEDINVLGTRGVFSAAKDAGVTRIVYASSAAVYGNAGRVPVREDDPLEPLSPYAASKIANEKDAAAYTANGLACAGLRFFNVYGPAQKDDSPYASVIAGWSRALRTGSRLVRYGDGSQTRDFVHVADVARALVLALEKSSATSVYNVASGVETSLLELQAAMERVLGRSLSFEERPVWDGDIKRSVADIGRARAELGFEPQVTLEDGLRTLLS